MPHHAYIGIGSNLGDRRGNVMDAVARIAALPGTCLVRVSSLYETEPLGHAPTWFVNAAAHVETTLPPERLLDECLAIERAMGRTRVPGDRWASRVIDLDVLLVDDAIVDGPTLTVPHPEMHTRRFVLVPLAEIAPELMHPRLGRSVASLLESVDDPKRVTPLA